MAMDAIPTPAEPKRRAISKRVREAIDLLAQGRVKTITAAAKSVGLTRERLSRALGEPHIAEHVRQKAGRTVAMGALRAAAREVQLIDAKSEHVSHDASKHVLAIAGIKPAADPNVNLNVSVKAGYILDLREPGGEMKIIAGADAIALPPPAEEAP